MVNIISSEFRKEFEVEIKEYLLKELEKYPNAITRVRGGIPTISHELTPIFETVFLIIQTILIMAHGKLIVDHWRHVKTMNDICSVLYNAAEESKDYVELISNNIKNLNTELNNFNLPNDARDALFVDLIKKIANKLADDDILSKDQKEKI